jgi:hypothetical protein
MFASVSLATYTEATRDTTEGSTQIAKEKYPNPTRPAKEKEVILQSIRLNHKIRKKLLRQYMKCSNFASTIVMHLMMAI